MSGTENWAILRQLVLASRNAPADGAQIGAALGLPEGFADPELKDHGMSDWTMPVGPQKFLEVVGPLDDSSSISRWLDRVGGAGGYCLAVQVPDVPAAKERAQASGVRIAVDLDVMGHPIIQLHPGDVGILLELDGISDSSTWFWDDITPGPSADAAVDDIASVTIGTPDPDKTCALWAQIIGLDPVDATTLDFSGTSIRFVGHPRSQVLAATLTVAAGKQAPAAGPMLGLDVSYE